MTEVIYPLKSCPWCNKTANFHMDCSPDQTWIPKILCKNSNCQVNPQTKYIPIRKKQRENPIIIKEKIERLIKIWNDGNLDFNNEGFKIDYEKIVKDFQNGKLGLPGYRQD
jgi:hypothetical protein